MKTIISIYKFLLQSLLTIFIIAMLILCFLLTPYGFKFSVYVIEKVAPGQIHYQQLSGLLTGPISIRQLNYQYKGEELHIDRMNLDYSPLALLHNKLDISHFTANGVTIIIPKPKHTAEPHEKSIKESIQSVFSHIKPFEPQPFKLPISIEIHNTHLSNIKIGYSKKDITTDIKSLRINGVVYPKRIDIQLHTVIQKPIAITATVSAIGSLKHYIIQATAENTLFMLNANGEGNQDGMTITIPKSNVLGGTAEGTLKAHWYPQINWNLALTVDNIDLHKLNPSLPKQASLTLASQGHILKANPIFDFKLHAQADKAFAKLEAHHHHQWHINWQIVSPNLAALHTDLSGSLNTKGYLKGTDLLLPQTAGTIHASRFHYNGIDIGTVQGQWKLFFDAKTRSQLKMTVNQIQYNEHKLDLIHLNLFGHLLKHDMTVKLDVGKHSLLMTTKAHYNGNTWTGAVTQFLSEHNAFGNWKLRKTAHFEIAPQKIFLQPVCLDANTGAYLCMQGQWQKDKPWNFSVTSKRFSFINLEKRAMINTRFTSLLSMNAQVSGEGSYINNANIKINVTPGQLTYFVDNKLINTSIRPSYIQLLINKKIGLQGEARLNMAIKDSINLNANIPNFNDHDVPFKDKQLKSNVTFLLHDFRFVTLVENVLRISLGRLSGHFTYNGTVGHAQLEGKAHLQIPHFEYTLAMVHAHNISADIIASGNKITYNLTGYAFNKAPLYLNGETDLTTPFAVTKFTITGKNAQVIKNSKMSVYADTTLNFLLTHDNLAIDGNLFIPKAQVSLINFSNTLEMPKGNVVYIGLPSYKETKPAHTINLKLNFKLGKDVNFAAYGARAKLGGEINIKMSPKQTMIANGQVFITKGTFQAYGQYLIFAKGSSVSFIESPVTNPFIDARAFKYVNTTHESVGNQMTENNIIVGVHVHGTLRAMKFSLYSQPPDLSQADILSYLVLGYASDSSNTANLSVLLDAANAMVDAGGGLNEPMGLTDRLKQGLGIKELGVRNETVIDAIGNPVEDQSSFVVGDQLTKKIYIQYSRGIIVPDNIFTVEYRLNKNWILQTQTGSGGNVGTGADVIYKIDTN